MFVRLSLVFVSTCFETIPILIGKTRQVSQVPGHPFSIMPWSNPEGLLHTFRPYTRMLFSPYMKKVNLFDHIHFGAVLTFKLLPYGLILPFLPLHTPDYSDAWEVPYCPGG